MKIKNIEIELGVKTIELARVSSMQTGGGVMASVNGAEYCILRNRSSEERWKLAYDLMVLSVGAKKFTNSTVQELADLIERLF